MAKLHGIWIGAGLVGVVVLAGVAFWRLNAAEPASEPARPVVIPVEHRAGTMAFDLNPKDQGVEHVVMGARERVQAEGAKVVPAHLADGLAQSVGERLQIMLAPSYEAWTAEVSRFTKLPPEGPTEFDKRGLKERWEACSEGMRAAPIASAGITVRRIDPGAKPVLITNAPGSFIKAATTVASADYPKPPLNDPRVIAVEVLVPVMYRTKGASDPDQPGTSVLRLFWSPEKARWCPYDFMVFFDYSASGKTLPMPVL